MLSGISKKVIFTYLLFINFIQLTKSAELQKIKENENNQSAIPSLPIVQSNSFENYIKLLYDNNYETTFSNKKFLRKNSSLTLADNRVNNKELIIQSDKQFEINDVIYAEGNVSVSYRGKLLITDTLIYDKLNKNLIAEGDISLVFGKQMFKMKKLLIEKFDD